jgi:endoglucanase
MWGWESRLPAAYVLFAEVANARPGIAISAGLDPNVTGWIAEADFYFDTIVNNELTNGTITPGGLLSYEQLSNLNSLQPALAAAHLLFRYAPMASTKGKTEQYQTFAQSQVDYWLGKNPMNAPYMIGLHPNSPQKPHNSMASGADVGNTWDWDIILSVPEKYKHKLVGAVPGGPLIKPANQTDLYWDDMTDWQMAEPSLDYAANAPVLAAYELCIGAEDPYYVNLEASSIKLPDTQPCDFANECLLT